MEAIIKDIIPYPNGKWGVQLDNGYEVFIQENVDFKLPEGEYNIDIHELPVYFLHPDNNVVTFVYREFGTKKIKLYEIDITEIAEENFKKQFGV